jgi:hypothetical protein
MFINYSYDIRKKGFDRSLAGFDIDSDKPAFYLCYREFLKMLNL